jgi:alpha-L-rhamnosidase
MDTPRKIASLSLLALLLSAIAGAQTAKAPQPEPLDPTRNLVPSSPVPHAPLPEQYLWTANDVTAQRPDRNKYPWTRTELRIAPHFFRAHFNVAALPQAATLYLAGPREAHVFLNGKLLGDFNSDTDAPINFRVFHVDALQVLRPGDNVLAIQAIRGRGVVSATSSVVTQQLAYGEVLVAKLIPAAFGVEAQPLIVTDSAWKSSATPTPSWSEPAFDDSAWQSAASLGPIESNVDFFQWNADAGMYGWPGYRGMSPSLRTYALSAAAVSHVFTGRSTFTNLQGLTADSPSASFTVTTPTAQLDPTDAEAPSLLLDFGREVAGRLFVESASPTPATLSIAYGESEIEAMATGLTPGQQGGNYLGTNLIEVPANGAARGPKSGFRYVRIRFLRGAPVTNFKAIRLEGIDYPVQYQGSFESSDPLLNRIWETGAYTAHLCMQDGLWDAPKRDRGRWVGDIDVEGRVLNTVFGDPGILEDTLRRLAEETPPDQHVNGITSYSALWITSLDSLYMHTGDKAFLESQHAALLRILARMDQDIAPDNLLTTTKSWGFVDWAPGLYGFTPDTRIGTNLQYLRGYAAAAQLLKDLGDQPNAAKYAARSDAMSLAARSYLDPATQTIGRTWQLNTLAVLDRLATPATPPAGEPIWDQILSHVKQDAPTDQAISPYFNAYLLDAMASLDHRAEALTWLRAYWGGMLAEGATSFWESYDLRWPKSNPHLSLQADGTSGAFVSLAHGWSSGPTAWLSENVLGITPASPGYNTVNIRPTLLGLDFARGSVPTPHGLISIRIDRQQGIALDLPPGITLATVTYTTPTPGATVYLDGKPIPCHACSNQATQTLEITQPGHHTLQTR